MKKLFGIFLTVATLLLCVTLFPTEAEAATTASGTCGDNLTWTLDDTGTLTISGTGAMTNYSSYRDVPWYSNLNSVIKVVIGNKVTTIGDYAFYYCTSLTNVTISNSVTSIGSYAFYSCHFLTSVTIPNSVTTIGDRAFFDCDRLTEITVSANNPNYSSDEQGVLYNKNKTILIQAPGAIETCVIPASVTTIDNYAFRECYSMSAFIVSAYNPSYSSDEQGILYNKDKTTLIQSPKSIETCVIPDSVTKISDYAFSWCTSLTGITIGESVTTIGYSAFENCRDLTDITFPDSVTTIGYYAFNYCYNLTSVTFGNGVTTISESAFQMCSRLSSITFGNSLTTIGNDAFYYCTSLTSVTIPDSVTTIGDEAFEYCTNLSDVSIGNSVTTIGTGAFDYCDSLIYKIYDNGKYLGNSKNPYYVLMDTTSDSITSCRIHPDTKIIIGAFSDCWYQTSVTIPDGVLSIGDGSFNGCWKLTGVTIPNSVTTIGRQAFSGCYRLTSVNIPESVTNIGANVFNGCSSLTYKIYDKGKYLGNSKNPYYALIDTTSDSISSCQIHPDTKIISNAFSGCKSLTNVTIPNGVTSIGCAAFHSCDSLTSVTIPTSVTIIDDEAFAICSNLASVTFGNSITTIGDYAFVYCDSLTSVTYCGTEEQWNTISIGLSNGKLNNATRKYHDFNEGVVTKEPTIIETGIKTYTCSNCGDSYTEEIPVAVPTDDATLVLRNDGALNLAAFIGAQFSVTAEIAEKYDSLYIEITHNGLSKTIELRANDDGSVYFAEYGVAAKQMTDPIDIKLFAKKDGTTYIGQSVEGWTVKAKLVSMLDQYYEWMSYGGAYEMTPKLAAATLAYGAAAQKQFSYNLDNLATDGVQAKYLALVPIEAPVLEAVPSFDGTGYQASLYNPAFVLDDVIKASLTFAIGDTKIENYKARVTINGVTEDYELTQYVANGNTYPGYAYIIIDSIVAADLRNDFSVTIMKGNTATSTTYTFSMENMAARLMNSRPEIITAIMHYSDAAYARFRAQ